MIKITHNFDEKKLKWLWAKYVTKGNNEKHCQACLHGPYSKKFSGTSNKDLLSQPVLVMDEKEPGTYKAIYFCGVVKKGYPKSNYPHNVHFAVLPKDGASDNCSFEDWTVHVDDGIFMRIPSESEIARKYFSIPYDDHYFTCRIFRWMLSVFYPQDVQY